MTVEAYAKVNLTLEVLGKRPDGFHALRSVVLPIGLSDTLTFTPAETFSSDTGYPDDLILKAAKALADLRPPTARLQPYRVAVVKRIPAGGGLGGGSADAAVTLLALNELWRLGLSPEELATVGARVGSDVPALVLANRYGVPVRMEGRGEIVAPLERTDPFFLVLANPGVSASTAAVYGRCLSRPDDGGETLRAVCAAMAARDLDAIAARMTNDLQVPAFALYPAIGDAAAALRQAGVRGVMMSGSGSSVFGFVETESEGRRIAECLGTRGMMAFCLVAPCRASFYKGAES